MKPLARKNQLFVEEVVGECVVYDSSSKKAHTLSSTATWIWRHCDGSTDIKDIAFQFEREFACEDSLDLVVSAIQQLQSANLLVSAPESAVLSALMSEPVMSRRSVVAAGSALLPVVTSILVPTAQAAKSGYKDKPKQGK